MRFEATGPQLFQRDAASSYAWWGNLVVVFGRQPPDASHVANYRACIAGLHAKFPAGVGVITVVNEASTPLPSGREALITLFQEVWPSVTAALFIPNASGFKAAVLRSVMGCFILASRQRDRIRVERTIPEGLPWLAAKVLGAERGSRELRKLEHGITKFCEVESAWSGRF